MVSVVIWTIWLPCSLCAEPQSLAAELRAEWASSHVLLASPAVNPLYHTFLTELSTVAPRSTTIFTQRTWTACCIWQLHAYNT